jgi:hypothetical protein
MNDAAGSDDGDGDSEISQDAIPDAEQSPQGSGSDFEREDEDDEPTDAISGAFSPISFDVTTRRIRDIFASYNEGELDTTPAFQRGYVWDRVRASRLIESVLLRVPLPLVYTAEDEAGSEVVIDGQQRLLTFIGFLQNKFPKDEKPFRLSKLKILTELNGKTFSDLDDETKRAFRLYGVSVIRIASGSNPDVKFEIFERLNTGAVTLSAQELRNCIFRGPLNNKIKDLASHISFLNVLSLKQAPQRMIDCEMVIRFLAFHERTHLNYPGKMKSFMNNFMKINRYAGTEQQEEWAAKFILACENIYTVFGSHAFRRYKLGNARDRRGGWETPVNKALFDCLMFWFARYEKRQIVAQKDEIRERILDMMVNDREFGDAIVLGTSDVSRVKTRFEKIDFVLRETISTPPSERRRFTYSEKKNLFDADPTCGFCGQRIETIDDAEVDHRVRFADGGRTDPSNARLAHRYCNRAARPS